MSFRKPQYKMPEILNSDENYAKVAHLLQQRDKGAEFEVYLRR
jgi:hypothetical protein